MKQGLFVFLFSLLFEVVLAQTIEAFFSLETETGNIEGSLMYPISDEKIPLALIIAGSGPTDRDGNNPAMTNNSLKMLAEGLAQHGIASLRYDKRGIGQSKEAGLKESDLRFEHYIEDAESWIDTLKNDKRFSEIIVVGHSEGSLIGMIAARNEEVAKFISIAGSGVPAGDKIREQLRAQPPNIMIEGLNLLDRLEKGETVDSIPKIFYALFRPSVQSYIISWFKYDPTKEIAKLDKPILVLQGTTDLQVGVSDASLLAIANENATKQIIEWMNHVLKRAEPDGSKNLLTYSDPDLPLIDGLIDIIVEFMNK